MGCRPPGTSTRPPPCGSCSWRDGTRSAPPASAAQCGTVRRRPADGTGLPDGGGYLSDVSGFDADFFGVSGREADVLDPATPAAAGGGLGGAGTRRTRTGPARRHPHRLSSPGLSYNDYMDSPRRQPREQEGSILTNGALRRRRPNLLPTGPAAGPACPWTPPARSSLVAVHLAAQALRDRECDLALAGGVTLIFGSRDDHARSTGWACSHPPAAAAPSTPQPTASCEARAADRRPQTPRRRAPRRRPRPRGGTRLGGQPGRPLRRTCRAVGHRPKARPVRRALARAGIDPREVGMVETHGTGTPVGDPVEFSSLAEVYGVARAAAPSARSRPTSATWNPPPGVAGLIKAVLCLDQGLIPPNLHFTRWNPAIDAEATRFFVPPSSPPGPSAPASRLAAVSSFGFSGTNAHVVLEQPPADPGPPTRASPSAARRARQPPPMSARPTPLRSSSSRPDHPTRCPPRRGARGLAGRRRRSRTAARHRPHPRPAPRRRPRPPGRHRRLATQNSLPPCARSKPDRPTPGWSLARWGPECPGGRYGCSPARAPNGRAWDAACWSASPPSPPRSPRPTR